MTDQELLTQHVLTRSDQAFRELVARHIDMVYSMALRQVGDRHLAEDVCQAVFLLLMQKAKSLTRQPVLSAWLLTATRYVSANARKVSARRVYHEQKAGRQMPIHQYDNLPAGEPLANELLEEGVAQLGNEDRQAILLRFYERRDMRDVGLVMGISEEAAKKRVSRAVDKLRRFFKRKGVVVSVSVLLSDVLANAVHAAPPELAASTAQAVLMAATGAGSSGAMQSLAEGAKAAMRWTQAKWWLARLVTTAAVGVGGVLAGQRIQHELKVADEVAALVSSLEMVQVPGGLVRMFPAGPDGMPQMDANPASVQVKPFLVTRTEITQEQFGVYTMLMHPNATRTTSITTMPKLGGGSGKSPANFNSPQDVEAFCQWLSRKTGRKFRLPTEAEWEYACRAGDRETPAMDADELSFMAWYAGNSWDPERARLAAHAVATKQPNAWGVYDMLGNVAECAVAQDGRLVIKGGSFLDKAKDVNSYARVPYRALGDGSTTQPNQRLSAASSIGIRLVCEPK